MTEGTVYVLSRVGLEDRDGLFQSVIDPDYGYFPTKEDAQAFADVENRETMRSLQKMDYEYYTSEINKHNQAKIEEIALFNAGLRAFHLGSPEFVLTFDDWVERTFGKDYLYDGDYEGKLEVISMTRAVRYDHHR